MFMYLFPFLNVQGLSKSACEETKIEIFEHLLRTFGVEIIAKLIPQTI